MEIWGLPYKRVWYVQELPWKLVGNSTFVISSSPISSVCGTKDLHKNFVEKHAKYAQGPVGLFQYVD